MSDHKGAILMLPYLPSARELLGDKAYDSKQLRQALIGCDLTPCIPSKRNRKQPIPYDKLLYRQRHCIENMFSCLKD